MQKDNSKKANKFSRRVFMLTTAKWAIFFIFFCRMFYLQIIKQSDYKTQSDKNSISAILLEPERGKILDRNDVEIANNQTCYRLALYKQKRTNTKDLVAKLNELFSFNQEEYNELEKKVKSAHYLRPTTIIDKLSWNDVCKFEEKARDITDAYIATGNNRHYPMGSLFAHITGYMGAATHKDTEKLNIKLPKEIKVGKSGVEKTFEQSLLGSFGMKKVEVNAYRVVIREISEQPTTPGKDLKLAIDSKLQAFAYSKLENNVGSVVVLDAQNGKVLTMLSTPSFDPNILSEKISSETWESLVKNKNLPLTNKTITSLYPPGSTFKIATSIAILSQGIDPEQKILCTGSTDIGGRTFKCWKKDGHGYVDFHKAVAASCNCYFYIMGTRAGIDSIYDIASKLGLGKKTNIQLTNESAGILPCKQWKNTQFKQNWYVGDTVNATIGQGYVLTTPIQLALMTARITSGTALSPDILYEGKNINEALDIPAEHLQMIRQGLSNVFNSPYGTSYKNRVENPDFAIAGKTGTAQVISQDTATNSNIFAKHHRSHSIFTGFGPANNPKYCCTVIIDNAGWGSSHAAPLAKDVLLFAMQNENKQRPQ